MPDCAKDVLAYINKHGGRASYAAMKRELGGRWAWDGYVWLETHRYAVKFYDVVMAYHGELEVRR